MAYTSSALSFILENLNQTVVVTGAMVHFEEHQNDSVNNLLGALTVAGHYRIPEVTLFFNNKLFRGNRVRKSDTNDFETFSSPNFPPLANLNIDFEVRWADVLSPPPPGVPLSIFTELSNEISTFRIQPCLNVKMAEVLFLESKAVIIETYGMGNIPWKN